MKIPKVGRKQPDLTRDFREHLGLHKRWTKATPRACGGEDRSAGWNRSSPWPAYGCKTMWSGSTKAPIGKQHMCTPLCLKAILSPVVTSVASKPVPGPESTTHPWKPLLKLRPQATQSQCPSKARVMGKPQTDARARCASWHSPPLFLYKCLILIFCDVHIPAATRHLARSMSPCSYFNYNGS